MAELAEVTRRTGHGVAVLLKIHVHCIDGQAHAANQHIANALSTPEAEKDPAPKAIPTVSRQPEVAGQR